MIKYIILFGLIRLSLGLRNEDICNAEQVNAAFYLDGTSNVRPEQLQYMVQLIEHIADTYAKGSDGTCAFINDEKTDFITFKSSTENNRLKEKLKMFIDNTTLVGSKIYSRALENEVTKRSTVSRYKKRAEILYLIITDETEIETFPEILMKKKLFVIVLGKDIPKRLKDLASSSKHVYLINKLEDVERVTDLVANQTCIDSHFKCDVDQYMAKRSIKCISCMSVCSSVTVNQSISCRHNCPYIHLPSKKAAEKPEQIFDSKSGNNSAFVQAKETVRIAVTCSIILVVVVVVSLVVYKVIRRKCTNNFRTKREIPQIEVHVSDPIQESRTQDTQVAGIANGIVQPLLGENANNSDENDDGFNLHFKNNNELVMNGLVFGGPDFQDVN